MKFKFPRPGGAVIFGVLMVLALLPVPASGGEPAATAGQGEWSYRTQLVLDGRSRQLRRMRLRVWDPHPELGLEFYWEPTWGAGVPGDGTVSGWGTLTWRPNGAPRYTRESVYSTYKGQMRNGRPEGVGRLWRRDGLRYEGEWSGGVFHGSGALTLPSGDQYDGEFRRGLQHGAGRHAAASGEIFTGRFHNGRRHGPGTVTLADGRRISSTWSHGVEAGRQATQWKPFADADERVDLKGISVGVMPAADEDLSYKVTNEGIRIEPAGRAMRLLNAQGVIKTYHQPPYGNRVIRLNVQVANANARPVEITDVALEVAESVEDRRPVIVIGGPDWCTGSQAGGEMSVRNLGWTPLENVRLTLAFVDDKGRRVGPWFEKPLGEVGAKWTSVAFEDALSRMGADAQALAKPFNCARGDAPEACVKRAVATGRFGRLAGIAKLSEQEAVYSFVQVGIIGKISYDWKDLSGRTRSGSMPYELYMNLQQIFFSPSECGDITPFDPAPKQPPLQLRMGARDYRLSGGLRGKVALAKRRQFTFRLSGERTSSHRLRAVVSFSDGSRKASPWVDLTIFRGNE